MPGIYVRQAMAAEQSAPAAIGNITAPPTNDVNQGSVVTQHAAPSVVTQHAAPDQFLSHANMLPAARWADQVLYGLWIASASKCIVDSICIDAGLDLAQRLVC